MYSGQATVTTHNAGGVPLVPSSNTITQKYCNEVMVQANQANAGYAYIKYGTGVSSTVYGARLRSDESWTIGPNEENDIDLSQIYVDTDNDGEGVSFTAGQR